VDGGELSLPWFEWAAQRDSLNEQTLAQVLAGVSMRDYAGTLEPVPASVEQRAVSKSAASRRFITLTTEQLRQWIARPLGDLDLRVVILDTLRLRLLKIAALVRQTARRIWIRLSNPASAPRYRPNSSPQPTYRLRAARS
jgi:hypothetical protein